MSFLFLLLLATSALAEPAILKQLFFTNDRNDDGFITTSLAFSPDGKAMASSGTDLLVRLWDLEAGEETFILRGNRGPGSVQFSPDGKLLIHTFPTDWAGNFFPNDPTIWNLETNDIYAPSPYVTGLGLLEISPDGKIMAELISGLRGQEIRVASTESDSLHFKIEFSDYIERERDRRMLSICFSPDGSLLATGGVDDKVFIWDAANGELQTILWGSDAWDIMSIFFSSEAIISINKNGRLKAWDLEAWDLVAYWDSRVANTWALSQDRNTLAISTDYEANIVELVDTRTWETRGIIDHFDDLKIRAIAFSPDGTLATAGIDSVVTFWDISEYEAPDIPTSVEQRSWGAIKAAIGGWE